MVKETYTVAQAAKKLRVSTGRIRQLIERGRLHPINEPAPLMLAADEVEHYKRGKPGRKPRELQGEL
jgi:hypothetical protein